MTAPIESAQQPPHDKMALKTNALRLLDACLKIRDTPTAVVIMRAGDFLRFNGAERELAGWFARWPQAAVDNVCVLVFTEQSAGQTAAFNGGLQAASGDVIVFLDADDTLLPGALETMLSGLEANPRCAAYAVSIVDGRTGRATQAPRAQGATATELRCESACSRRTNMG